MSSEAENWNRYVGLTDRMHTAPTAEERAAAKRERLNMELAATYAARTDERLRVSR